VVDKTIISRVNTYLNRLKEKGLSVEFGVIFGSYTQARADQMSDIDVIVVSPIFDGCKKRRDIDLLWHVAAKTITGLKRFPAAFFSGRKTIQARLLKWPGARAKKFY
jgi:predicted nucleotidyltransferase